MRLENRVGLVVGVANDDSIAAGRAACAARVRGRWHRREVSRVPVQDRRRLSIGAVGDVAAFLASDAASGVTGTITHIDGGRHVRC